MPANSLPDVLARPPARWGWRAAVLLAAALVDHPRIRHIKIADGIGPPLGRSFGVKLWPTLVFLTQGKETARLIRPDDSSEIRQALARIDIAG